MPGDKIEFSNALTNKVQFIFLLLEFLPMAATNCDALNPQYVLAKEPPS